MKNILINRSIKTDRNTNNNIKKDIKTKNINMIDLKMENIRMTNPMIINTYKTDKTNKTDKTDKIDNFNNINEKINKIIINNDIISKYKNISGYVLNYIIKYWYDITKLIIIYDVNDLNINNLDEIKFKQWFN
jgi:hypothetical protein